MAAKQEDTPWDDFLSDFTLLLDSGEELKCHKVMLAKASPVLKRMLMTEMKEKQSNVMRMTGFDLKTVTCLLQYIYQEECTVEKKELGSQTTTGIEKQFFVKNIGSKLSLSPQLMRLAHMYQVQGLVYLCEDKLKSTKPTGSVGTPWTAKDIRKLGEDLDMVALKECSERWLASEAFQTLWCSICRKTTVKPLVYLECGTKTCGDYGDGLVLVSGAQVTDGSKVTIKLQDSK